MTKSGRETFLRRRDRAGSSLRSMQSGFPGWRRKYGESEAVGRVPGARKRKHGGSGERRGLTGGKDSDPAQLEVLTNEFHLR